MLSNKKYIIIIIALLIICLVLIFVKCGHEEPQENLNPDDSAVHWDGEQDLSKPIVNDKPAIAIPGIKELVFSAGTKTQQVNFYNPEENDCYFKMELYVDGDLLWESGNVAPGDGYYTIELNKSLPAGERVGFLHIRCFKQDGTELNSAQVKFNLIIQ